MEHQAMVAVSTSHGVDPSIVSDGFMMAALLTMGTLFGVIPLVVALLISPKETHPRLGAIYE